MEICQLQIIGSWKMETIDRYCRKQTEHICIAEKKAKNSITKTKESFQIRLKRGKNLKREEALPEFQLILKI